MIGSDMMINTFFMSFSRGIAYFRCKDSNFYKKTIIFAEKLSVRRYLLVILSLLSAICVQAQISFTSSISKVSDKELLLRFDGKVEDGYHLNTDLVMESLEGVMM